MICLPGMKFGYFEELKAVYASLASTQYRGLGGGHNGGVLGKNRRTNTNLGGEKQVLASIICFHGHPGLLEETQVCLKV